VTDFERLFSQAPCGYLTTSDDGTITTVNDTFLRWTGHQESDLVGTRLQKLFPIGDQVLYSTHCQPLLRMVGAVAEIAVEVVGVDRVRRAALLSAAREPATPEAPAEVRVVIFSAHERRRYEKELLAARRRAEHSDAQRADAEADLARLVHHDGLTGLPNRTALEAHLAALLARPGCGRDVALLYVGLDHFKVVNDSLGRAAGDELLVLVGERLTAGAPPGAMVARLGGDEFVVVETGGDVQGVTSLAAGLLVSLAVPMTIEGVEIETSASIGAAQSGADSDTAEGLLRNADIAMYRAKARGRNTWELHDGTVSDPAIDRLRLIGELRRGIERGELRVHYQPRIDLATGEMESVEALVRWQHPTRGLLSPAHFIDLAEETGLVRPLGAWVLEEAVRQAVQWRDTRHTTGRTPVEMSVNLSPRQLAAGDVVEVVTGILQRHGLEPALLTLEITETALVTDADAALAALTALKRLGVQLAVDDFGTGYSSLTYLQRFPVDELKIDQSFVAGLGTGPGDTAIVASCVQLAHAIGLRAVAEGVETEDQRRALVELGCDVGQGYLFSRPVPAVDLDATVAAVLELAG